MELKERLKQIYENDGMENSFFIVPFLTILLKHSQSEEYLWMSESFKERFTDKVQEKNIRDSTFIETEYESMYNDTLNAHGLNFNSSHAISQKITGSDSWLKDYIDYDGYTKEGEQKTDNSAGLRKPYYKLRRDKIGEVEQALKSIDEKDIRNLISVHKNKSHFTKEDFELFSRWAGKEYDKTNPKHRKAKDDLNELYSKTEEWANYVNKQKNWGRPNITKSAISPSLNTRFTDYHWARLSPSGNKDLAYVVSIFSREGKLGFSVSIDTYSVNSEIRGQYFDIRDDNHIVSYLPMEEGIGKSFKELGEWALEEFSGFSPSYDELLNTLFPESSDSEAEGKSDSENDQGTNEKTTINQILYGPPGTGKTYNTVNKAIEIIEPNFIKNLDQSLSNDEMRREIKSQFDVYLKSGEIAFTTFHQSYGYEDFVEGIKAETVDNQINYSVEPGIFKQLCEKASANIERAADESDFQLGNKRVWKMSLGNSQTDEGDSVFQECRSNSYILLGYGDDIDFSGCDSQQKVKDKYISSGYEPKNQDYSVSSVHTFINKIKVGDIIIVSDGNHRYRAIAEVTGEYQKLVDDRDHWFQMRSVKWHVVFNPSQQRENICKKAFSQMTLYELKSNTLNRVALQELFVPKNISEDGDKQPYVLIIDEINRGNISKIFGELITLIEPDKREGEEEALTVILPYSKEPFSVPKNVHIIGTMNTADASIAKLDVALRRRFKFTEMPPEPSLLYTVNFIDDDNNGVEIDLKKMLTVINQRIELLYDRDHTIGHSFFMKLTNGSSIADLASIFEKEIIPLLQEYFFDDWERIHWVLDALKSESKEEQDLWFVRKKDMPDTVMGERWKSDTNQSVLTDVWKLNVKSFSESQAYIGIYSPIRKGTQPSLDSTEKSE